MRTNIPRQLEDAPDVPGSSKKARTEVPPFADLANSLAASQTDHAIHISYLSYPTILPPRSVGSFLDISLLAQVRSLQRSCRFNLPQVAPTWGYSKTCCEGHLLAVYPVRKGYCTCGGEMIYSPRYYGYDLMEMYICQYCSCTSETLTEASSRMAHILTQYGVLQHLLRAYMSTTRQQTPNGWTITREMPLQLYSRSWGLGDVSTHPSYIRDTTGRS